MSQTSAAASTPALQTVDLTSGETATDIDKPAVLRLQPEHLFRKKIVATAFAVNQPSQVADIDDIAQGFPRELISSLEKSRQFVTRHSPHLLSFTYQQEAPGIKLIQQVAAENDSQFVIAGEIRNAGQRIEKKYFGLWETRKRHIEIAFAIYDGQSGSLLSRHQLQRQAEDQASVGRNKPFGSAVFFATGYGQVIASLLEEATQLIAQDLAPFPVMAKIIKVNKNQIVLDTGATSAIATGDLATVVVAGNNLPLSGLQAYQSRPTLYGNAQTSLGKATIVQVQYLFSVAELAADIRPGDVNVGDFVRFDTPLPK
ncbi:hypothetical protein BH11PSE12_BH11PSE12_02780 [soil metagenome]